MWRLLQTEMAYNRVLWGVLIGIYIPFLVVFALFGAGEMDKSLPAVLVFMWSLSVVFSVFYMMDMSKTRRNRLLSIIPVSPLKVSLARICIFVGFWLVLTLGFWGVFAAFHASAFGWEAVFGFLSLSGIVLFIHSCYLLALDVRFWLVSRRMFKLSIGEILSGLIPALLLGFFVLAFLSQGIFAEKTGLAGEDFFSSPKGGIFFLILGLAFSALDIAVFTRRRSFSG